MRAASMLVLGFWLAVLPLFGADAWAQGDARAAENSIKTAFLLRFPEYIEWPDAAFAGPDSPFVIGVLGADPLAGLLVRGAAGRRVDTRPVTVRRLRSGDSLAGVQLLFIGAAESTHAGEILAALKGQPVLVASESTQAFQQGSTVNFVVVDDKVRFDVYLPSAEQANLRISARLLSVARKVESRPW